MSKQKKQETGTGGLRLVGALLIALTGTLFYLGFHDNRRGNPDMFMQACVDGPLAGHAAGSYCGDIAAIRRAYGVDPTVLIEQRRVLMVKTARRVARGELKQLSAYESCIHDGECAPVPLLPANVDSARVAGGSQYLETRKAFWQLTENSKLTPEICTFIPVCKALRQSGAIRFDAQKG
jgi:hypothetical protein